MPSYSSHPADQPSNVPWPDGAMETSLAGLLASMCTGLLPGQRFGGDESLPSRPLPGKFPGKHGSAAKPKILVVDDEPVIADTMAEILNDSGFYATAAYNGKAAMKAIQEECPDIVLTDVIMPGMNGVELAKFVADTCSDTKVLLLSGQATVSDLLRQAHELGYSFELLAKPLHPDELIEKLRR